MFYRTATIAAMALGAMVCVQGFVTQEFSAALPEGWQSSPQVTLVLQQVEVPRNTPATLRVYAVEGEKRDRHLLGSYGLPAESRDAPGTRTLERLPIAVTSGLRRWKTAPAGAAKITLVVEPVDGAGKPLERFDWKARGVTFEAK